MSRIFVDDRLRGQHGIGRYSQEVLRRLDIAWTALDLGGKPSRPLDAVRTLPREVRTGVVYSTGYGALLQAPRQVLTIHDLIHLQTGWPARALHRVYYGGPVRHQVRKCGVVVTVSETSAEAIRAWVRDDSVRVVNAGIGCSATFTQDGPISACVEPYFLYVGSMRPHKNLDVVLRALAARPRPLLRAVLPPADHERARQRAAELGVSSRLELLHSMDDNLLAALYRGAVATLMPSRIEGFGLPPLESIRCGTPVIYWNGCRPVAETVGDRGWAVGSADDPEEWAVAIESAMSSARRVDAPSGAEYSWDRTAAIVTHALLELTEARHG